MTPNRSARRPPSRRSRWLVLTTGMLMVTLAAPACAVAAAAPTGVGATRVQAAVADTTAPSVPIGLVTTIVGTTVGLSWELSTDNVGVTGYRVIRDGAVRGTTNDTTYQETGLAAGTYTYSVAAFDAAGNVSGASPAVSATVDAAESLTFLTAARLPDATVGQPYLASIAASDPPGPSTFKFTLISGKIPAGTRLVKNTLPTRPEVRILGNPTMVGTSTFTVRVTDGTGATARRTFTVSVLAAPALAIAGGVNVLPAGTVGQPYGAVLSATGGVMPYTWAITAGTLPPGVTRVGAAFFGTPTATGTYLFTARVSDSRGTTASGQFSISVAT